MKYLYQSILYKKLIRIINFIILQNSQTQNHQQIIYILIKLLNYQIFNICQIYFQLRVKQDKIMKNFKIDEIMIYNPLLISKKKKAIQSDVQQAKIIAYYPSDAPIQQKCNNVGMAQGVYAFCQSLMSQQSQQKTIQTIYLDQCCLVLKQMQQNIWIFIKVSFNPDTKYHQKKPKQQQDEIQIQSGYLNCSFNEQILQQLINHFYFSFKTFYGKIGGYLFLQRLFQLQKIIDYFVPKYQQINSYPNLKQYCLDISSYLIKNIRAIPLDVNTTLKFGYFKNVMQNYQPAVMDIIVFTNGLLAYTTLEKKTTQFFSRYLFGTNQPFKFEQQKIQKRFKILHQIPSFNSVDKYGTIFNSLIFGFQDDVHKSNRDTTRSSISIRMQQSQDLLGIQQKKAIQLIDVYLVKNKQQVKYKLNYFIQKNMIFLTFYRNISSVHQLTFLNRFYHDNTHKFSVKINQILSSLNSQTDNYRFLFLNNSTYIGKCTFKDWIVFGNQIKYTLSLIKNSIEGQVATTFQSHWVYGIKRMNRTLVLLIPNDVPLHKLEDFTNKMTKQYFFKCFM